MILSACSDFFFDKGFDWCTMFLEKQMAMMFLAEFLNRSEGGVT
jgi:hypothetical protein